MDFEFSEEQRALGDSIERFLQDNYSLDNRRAASATERGYSPELWQKFADLGWLALPISEDAGGLGCGGVETMILMQAFGRHLVVEPYLGSSLLAAGLIDRLGSPAQKEACLPALIAGRELAALAHSEPDGGYNLADISTRAEPVDNGYRLDGRKSFILAGEEAARFIVAARTSGANGDHDGITLFLVDSTADGLDVHGYPTIDGARAAELTLDGVYVPGDAILGDVDKAYPSLELAIDIASAAMAAEALGAMEALYEQTREFLMTRKQFGRPLAKFQVLQHRLVEMFGHTEMVRSLVNLASLRLEADDVERGRAVSAAMVEVGRLGRIVSQDAVQMHGGMGVTDELAISHYFKRLMAIDALFGNAQYHRRRFQALG